MVFPALFTAGMALIDTTDSVLMLSAYGWAFARPLRKLYYNLTITSVSILVALIVGGIETLGLVQGELNLSGPFWNPVAALNNNFGTLGYVIISVFVISWIVSVVFYKLKRYDDIAVRGVE
jgi:high-affinity nickel-transport protein